MTQATIVTKPSTEKPLRSMRQMLFSMELDTRLLGMLAALAIIWIGFNVASGGLFLTPRNLWNLSVQSSAIAIMSTGMVLIIVSRNIDLSVGSILGLTGYVMAMVQAVWIPTTLGLGFDKPGTRGSSRLRSAWPLGRSSGVCRGSSIAYAGVPSFIVTLGGQLVCRGLIFEDPTGTDHLPGGLAFSTLGGGLPNGALGSTLSWILGAIGCAAVLYYIVTSRRKRREYGFPVQPTWALLTIAVVGCILILAAVW